MKIRLKLVVVGLFLILLALSAILVDLHALLLNTLSWIDGLGAWGFVAFVIIYAIAAVFFVPGSILTLGAGFLWGVLVGTIMVSIASTLGAVLAFLVGRYIARDWIRNKLKGSKKLAALDRAVKKEGWKIVFLTRMSPIFPYNMLNYAYSLTGVRLVHYFLASWIGMLAWTVMYVYLGSLAGDLVTLGAGERTSTEWMLLVLGLLLTGVLVWYVVKLSRSALEEKIDTAELKD